MAISKVNFGQETLIDLTSDTVDAGVLMKGATAHNKAGDVVLGSFSLDSEVGEQDVKIKAIKDALKTKVLPSADTSDATASPEKVFKGETYYGKDGKSVGAFDISAEISEQDSKIMKIKDTLKDKILPSADTSDATATQDVVFKGWSYYGKNGKAIGAFDISQEISEQDSKISAIREALRSKEIPPSGNNLEICEYDVTIPVSAKGVGVAFVSDTGDYQEVVSGSKHIKVIKNSLMYIMTQGGSINAALEGVDLAPLSFAPANVPMYRAISDGIINTGTGGGSN